MACKEALDLGLLTEMELDPLEEDRVQRFCFRHLLFQEFAAGKWVATKDKVCFKIL